MAEPDADANVVRVARDLADLFDGIEAQLTDVLQRDRKEGE